MPQPFVLLDEKSSAKDRLASYEAQRRPATLGSHKESAKLYVPDQPLRTAIDAALFLGVPLLLTGEAGTGKTQVAYWLHEHLGLRDRLFVMNVQSTSTAKDLAYSYDAVAYFHAANEKNPKEELKKSNFVKPGPLWKALEPPTPRPIVLLDEIDKAPRDFPNDLLHVLDQQELEIHELGEKKSFPRDAAPPVIVVTSNSERKLPEPFLRRCVFHHIELTEDLVRRAVAARREAYPGLKDEAIQAAILRFLELRDKSLRKKPATAELLVWLILLGARGEKASTIEGTSLRELPGLGALIKDRDDLDALK